MPYLSAPVILLFQLPVIITDKFLVIIQQRVVLFMSSRHLDSQICCCTFLVSVKKNAINTLFFTILFTLFDRNVYINNFSPYYDLWIFPRNVLLYWIPIQFIYRYALYHIYDQCINFESKFLTKMHSLVLLMICNFVHCRKYVAIR